MFEYIWIAEHVALRLNHNIVVIGGRNHEMSGPVFVPTNEIYMYNLYTEQWRKHQISGNKPTPRFWACATVIGMDIYMFGGWNAYDKTNELFNDLWKLTRMTQGCFGWCKIEFQCNLQLPSPRFDHSAWTYEDCMWVFGGRGINLEHYSEYLTDHGEVLDESTNQLLCYDPLTQLWTNPQSSGAVPSPRGGHSTALIGDKVWLFASSRASRSVGHDKIQDNCFFELHMKSCTWTEIPTKQTIPLPKFGCSLITISNSQLVLHLGIIEGNDERSDTWIIDIPLKT